MYSHRNQDDHLLHLGRTATGIGLLALLASVVLGLYLNFPAAGIFFFSLFGFYIGMTSFWGIYNLNRWFRKYRFRMPEPLWYLLRIPLFVLGFFLGILLYGIFHQFVLLLALDDGSGKPGLLASLIILTPIIGPRFADYINYSPYGSQRKKP